jgi:hypothetical protein
MRTAPRVAAWAAWAAWICNRAIAGGITACNDWLQSQESGLRPALFFVRPAGRTHLEVKVLYTADMGKC